MATLTLLGIGCAGLVLGCMLGVGLMCMLQINRQSAMQTDRSQHSGI